MTPFLIALHIIIMFTATALAQGPAFLLWRAMRREDVAAMRGIVDTYQGIGIVVGPLYGIGVIVGLIAVFVGRVRPVRPVADHRLRPYAHRLRDPVARDGPAHDPGRLGRPRQPARRAVAELRAAISHATTPLFWVDAILIVLFIIDMVVKPFS